VPQLLLFALHVLLECMRPRHRAQAVQSVQVVISHLKALHFVYRAVAELGRTMVSPSVCRAPLEHSQQLSLHHAPCVMWAHLRTKALRRVRTALQVSR
jgi:hypothetical protein